MPGRRLSGLPPNSYTGLNCGPAVAGAALGDFLPGGKKELISGYFFSGRAAALLLGLVFALLAGEAALRLGGAVQRYAQERRNSISLSRQAGAYRIMCLGESTTAAGGDRAWPAKLERLLNARYPGVAFSVVNKAVSGADMAVLMGGLEKNLDEVRPDLVITMMGINDGAIRYYHGMDGSSYLFRHSRLYRWFRLALDPRVTQQKTVPSVPPNTRARGQDDPFPELLANMKDTDGLGDRLRAKLRKAPGDAAALYLLGRYLTSPAGNAARLSGEGEALLLRAARLAPDKGYIYQALGEYYQRAGEDLRAVGMMEKSARLNSVADRWYCLGRYYRRLGMTGEAEKALAKAVDFSKLYDDALFELVSLREEQGQYAAAEGLLLRAVAAAPENEKVLQALVSFYEGRGNTGQAAVYRKELEWKRALLTGRTRGYYAKMAGILRARGIRLACLQYPMCPLGPLRTLLADLPGLIFVDNEEIFRKAVAARGSAYYFCDLFGGNFGHLTEEGHQLLARNVADSLAPYFAGTGPAGLRRSGS